MKVFHFELPDARFPYRLVACLPAHQALPEECFSLRQPKERTSLPATLSLEDALRIVNPTATTCHLCGVYYIPQTPPPAQRPVWDIRTSDTLPLSPPACYCDLCH